MNNNSNGINNLNNNEYLNTNNAAYSYTEMIENIDDLSEIQNKIEKCYKSKKKWFTMTLVCLCLCLVGIIALVAMWFGISPEYTEYMDDHESGAYSKLFISEIDVIAREFEGKSASDDTVAAYFCTFVGMDGETGVVYIDKSDDYMFKEAKAANESKGVYSLREYVEIKGKMTDIPKGITKYVPEGYEKVYLHSSLSDNYITPLHMVIGCIDAVLLVASMLFFVIFSIKRVNMKKLDVEMAHHKMFTDKFAM